MTESVNHFARLSAINVSEHIERKGGFAYISWPYAVSQLRNADPTATWEVRRFNDLPYLATEAGVFVEVAVTVQGVTLSQIHPVLDNKNRPLLAPTPFDINTSIQRALVKAIALHGLGLSIYAGEDLPDLNGGVEPTQPPQIVEKPKQTTKVTAIPRTAGSEWLTDSQLRFVQRLLTETGTDRDELLAYFGYETLDTIPKAEVNRVIKALESKRRAA